MFYEKIISREIKKKEKEKEILKIIFTRVKNKIDQYSKSGATSIEYVIPNIIIGISEVDIEKNIKLVIKELRTEGFTVIRANFDTIFVSWDISDIKEKYVEIKKVENKNIDNIKSTIDKLHSEMI